MAGTSAKNGSAKAGQLILSQTFNIGAWKIRYYSVFFVGAIILGYFIGWWRAKRRAVISRQNYDDIVFWSVIIGFLSARVYYVLFYPQFYRTNFAEVFKIWHGGLSIYGGVIGGALTLWYMAQRRKINLSELTDTFVFALPLAQALGRFGNYFNYEAFGNPTNLPWKMFVPLQFRPPGFENYSYFQPTFAYEAIWDVLVFAALYYIDKKNPGRRGLLTGAYLILYSIGRFFIEAIRLDSAYILGLRGDQITAVILIIIGSIIIFRTKNVPQAN